MPADIFWLTWTAIMTGLLFLPYVLNRIGIRGLFGTMANPRADDLPESAWAQRAQRAHANAVENLPVFVALVAAAHFADASNAMTALGAAIYFWARLAHYVIYTAGIPIARTLAFFLGFFGEVLIAIELFKVM